MSFWVVNLDLSLQSRNRAHNGRIPECLLGSDIGEDSAADDPRGASSARAIDTNGPQ
jgi:hypothetical protein